VRTRTRRRRRRRKISNIFWPIHRGDAETAITSCTHVLCTYITLSRVLVCRRKKINIYTHTHTHSVIHFRKYKFIVLFFNHVAHSVNTSKGFKITFQPSVSREGGYGLPITIQLCLYITHARFTRFLRRHIYIQSFILMNVCVCVLYTYYKCYELTLRVLKLITYTWIKWWN